MLNLFYTLIIYPIESVLSIFYYILFQVFTSEGVAILGLSAIVTLLVLPLYNMADAWQDEEREKQRRMKPKLDDIKAAFHGDERHMIIRTYYRQQHYHPLMQLRSIIGLAIQVPFFIAAYHFLSHLTILDAKNFLFLHDLAKPDGLLKIGGISIHLMPILMTVINLMSAFVYANKLTKKELVQLVLMAFLFLVLLYPSPSGLVLYWTMNNFFSLIKNLVYRFSWFGLILCKLGIMFSGIALFYSVLLFTPLAQANHFIMSGLAIKKKIVFSFLCVAALALLSYVFYFSTGKNRKIPEFPFSRKESQRIFFLSCSILVFIAGIIIPASLIFSSPQEFVLVSGEVQSPLHILPGTFWKAFSALFFLPSVLYFLFKDRVKFVLTLLFCAGTLAVLVDVFLFSGSYGTISANLHFDNPALLNVPSYFSMLNLGVLLVCFAAVLWLLVWKHYRIITTVYAILLLTLIPMSAKYCVGIQKVYNQYIALSSVRESKQTAAPVFSLSKTKENVVIIMLDRAIGSFFPEILEYAPELKEQFSGFTYYPNTVSFNDRTMMGAPPVFGGYEYTPSEMNARGETALMEKHHEALLLLPKLFQKAGYNAVFTDPPYAGYSWVPDVSVLTKQGVPSEILEGRYTQLWLKEKRPEQAVRKRVDFLSFCFFRMFPVVMRKEFYNMGNYLAINQLSDDYSLLNGFSVLDYLPQLFRYDNKNSGCMILYSSSTHEPVFQANHSYVIPKVIDAEEIRQDIKLPFDNENSLCHFFINLAALKRVGIWLDALRENGVYDNTKIIIVADHGRDIETQAFGKDTFPARYNPLLIMKDFNASGAVTVCHDFMTNADVPALAVSHLPEDARKNPFTGKAISMDEKIAGVDIVTQHDWVKDLNNEKMKYSYREEDVVHVENDIFVNENWSWKVKK